MINEILIKSRVLFILDSCPYCRDYLEFIERINLNLPYNKQIKVIDCTKYHEFGIIEHPLISFFEKYIEEYPTLFFEGIKIVGSNTRIETEAWVKARVHDDFIIKEENPYLFNKECQYDRKGRIICN